MACLPACWVAVRGVFALLAAVALPGRVVLLGARSTAGAGSGTVEADEVGLIAVACCIIETPLRDVRTPPRTLAE